MAEETPVAATAPVAASSQPVPSIEENTVVKDEDAGEDANDVSGVADESEAGDSGRKVSNEQYKALRAICDTLSNYKIKDDYYPSLLFRRIPNKRNLPDYYEIIKEPSAISTLKGKIQRKEYGSIAEYVRDFALIVHNAQLYNRPNSGPVRDVLLLKTVFDEEMKKLVDDGLIAEEETISPDLGEIPYATPEPDPVSEEDEEAEDEGDEDDEDEDVDDSDDDKRRRRGRRAGRPSMAGRKTTREEDDEGGKGNDADARKRRGRPPRVDTPMEARIKAILKGIRKPKDKDGEMKIRHFEKLPDKQHFPHYYQEIKEPIAVDQIKKKAKRKKYRTLEDFMRDIDLMLDNAMEYNEDASVIYKDAVELKAEAHSLFEIEKAKPDEDYLMEEGRLPLPSIFYKNEFWKIGDWVHIQNPNDVTKPIVAQIYRTWQDPEGQKWVNACWYYRPEQTVHQFEKHFYPNEVVKTGQYRDHQIEEIIDRCFVMFFTRYSRGRPRDIDPDKEVYVCEARYNEEKHKLNKIKTWASCLPDEVRDKDYEMDLFDAPRKVKKVPSPLLHLLKDEAKDTDELPQPEWGHPNAPPRVGAIHRQARDENQSPPPEPTPPPPPNPPPQPARAPSATMLPHLPGRASVDSPGTPGIGVAQPPARPAMTPHPSSSYHGAPGGAAPGYSLQTPYNPPGPNRPYAAGLQPTPGQVPATPYTAQQPLHAPPSLAAAHPGSYTAPPPTQPFNRPALAPAHASHLNSYQAPAPPPVRAADVYVLNEAANAAIPKNIRDEFPQDQQGRVLFFTTPPVDNRRREQGRQGVQRGEILTHSFAYRQAQMAKDIKRDLEEAFDAPPSKRPKPGFSGEERDSDGRITADPVRAAQIQAEERAKEKAERERQSQRVEALQARALRLWVDEHQKGTEDFYKAHYGDKWAEWMQVDRLRGVEVKKKDEEAAQATAKIRERMVVPQPYTTRIDRDPWNGKYLDDYDPRYGF